MIDIWYMLIFGVVGYVFKKLDYPLAPLVLALVLGDLAENALRQSLIMSQGSLAIFFTRPIAGAITLVAIFFFALPIITPWWRRLRGAPAAAPAPRETRAPWPCSPIRSSGHDCSASVSSTCSYPATTRWSSRWPCGPCPGASGSSARSGVPAAPSSSV